MLATLRLVLLFVLLCWLGLALGLAVRAGKERGDGLDWPLPSSTTPAMQIPPIGINVVLHQFNSTERRAALTDLRKDGFGWVRQRFDWGELEPQSQQFSWQTSDEILEDIVAAGLIPIVVLDGSPAWARAPQDRGDHDNPFAPPANFADFARFAAAFAARYGEGVHFYQVWDEPNIAPHWGNRHIEPVAYAQLLKAAAAVIRAVDGDAVILTAALAPTADRGHTAQDEVYFLQRLYAAGAAPYFDAVAVQSFGFGSTPADERAQLEILNFQRIKIIRRAMIAAGDGATPLWAVRYGWNTRPDSPWGTVTPADQAEFATSALEIAHQWPWLTTLGWAMDQPDAPEADPLWGFALTPVVAKGIREWGLESNKTRLQSPIPNPQSLLSLWPFLGILLTLWRGYAAARLLPWGQWGAGYRRWPRSAQVLVWVILLLVYWLAAWPPLIVLCWIVGVILVAAHPSAGLWLLALTLPFYFQHKELHLVTATWVIAPAYAALLCLLPTLVGRLWLLRRPELFPRGPNNIDLLALAWLLVNLLASLNVWHWPAYGRGLLELAVAPVLIYLAVQVFASRPEQQQRMIVALFTGGGLVALIGLVEWMRGRGTEVDGVLRLVGPYFSPNHAALYLERTLFIGLGLALAASNRRHWWLAATGVVAVALLLTASRGALLLGLPVGLGVFGWLALRQRVNVQIGLLPLKRHLVWMISGVGLAGLVLLINQPSVEERLANSATLAQRWQIWQTTVRLWQDFPLVGVGPGGFFWRYPAYLTHPSTEPNILHPHNVWLEHAALWGLLGLVWLLLLIVIILRQTQRLHQEEDKRIFWLHTALIAGLAAGFAHAQVDAFSALADLALWNWLALGLLARVQKQLIEG